MQNNSLVEEGQLVHLKVYDQSYQKSKMLVICLAQDSEKYRDFYQDVTKKSTKKEIILNMIDHYYLDTDQIFYVFEMECFDSTLDLLVQKFVLPKQVISKTKDKITNLFNNNLHIFYKMKKQCKQVFYVCMNSQNQLNIKINLIDPNWMISSYFEERSHLNSSGSKQQNFTEYKGDLNYKISESVLISGQNYQAQDILQMISQFSNFLSIQIQKKDFLLTIQNNYTNILNFHPLEIFQIIENHPQYETFQILTQDESSFELKVNKRGKIITLKGIQYCDLSSAEKMLSQYQFVISSEELQNNSTILGVELAMIENYFYVLIEKSLVEYLDKHENNLSLIKSYQYIVLYAFLNFSYQILIQNDFQITKVNPFNLLLNKNQNKSPFLQKHIYKLRDKYKDQQQVLKIIKKYGQPKEGQNAFQSKLMKLSELNIQPLNNMNIEDDLKQSQFYQNKNQDQLVQQSENTSTQNIYFNQSQNNQEDNLILKKYLDQEKIIDFKIDEVSSCPNQYLSKYTEIINQCISQNSCLEQRMIEVQSNKLVQLFFQKISENKKEENSNNQINKYKLLLLECQNKLFNIDNSQYQQQIQLLDQFFTSQNNQSMQEYWKKLLQVLNKLVQNQISLEFYILQPGQLTLKQIVNQGIFNENQIQLMSHHNFQILAIKILNGRDHYFIKILTVGQQIFYLIGQQVYILVKQEYQSIIEIIKLEIELENHLSYFGQEYIYSFNNSNVLNFQLNLLGCKQLIQLNLELYSIDGSDKFNLKSISKQIDQTKINKIQIHCTSFEICNFRNTPNLTSFYKLKRLVSITLVEDYLEDTRTDFEKYSRADNFYENLLDQNRSF
ncbi:hypothetical protein ABPG72_019019 [Tetrahymena utriculariae]